MDGRRELAETYSVEEVAQLLGRSDQAIRNAAKEGRLPDHSRVGTGSRAPYRFAKAAIDGLDGVLPGGRPRRPRPDEDVTELVALVSRLQLDAATARTAQALAEQRIIGLEQEIKRLQGALRDVVERFTRPELPDVPSPG